MCCLIWTACSWIPRRLWLAVGENGRCGLGRQLLTDDRANERGQVIVPLAACHPARADALDRRRQNRIAPHQHAPRFFVTLRREARGGEARNGFRRTRSRHFIDAVSVTSASSSMSPGSTVVTVSERIVIVL